MIHIVLCVEFDGSFGFYYRINISLLKLDIFIKIKYFKFKFLLQFMNDNNINDVFKMKLVQI